MSPSNHWKAPVFVVSILVVALVCFLWVTRTTRRPTWEEFRARYSEDLRAALDTLRQGGIHVGPDCEVGKEDELNAFWNDSDVSGTDEHLRLLAQFPRLNKVYVDGTFVTDAGLSHLAELPLLKGIGISHSRITDQGLRHLSGLANLDVLELRFSPITGQGLVHLAHLPNLWMLDLTGSRVSTGFHHLANGSLNRLMLAETRVDDAALAEIGQISSLASLELDGTRITSAGMRHLAKLHRLAGISAGRTAVDDQGIGCLAEMELLTAFDLPNTLVTGTGFEAFQKRRNRELGLNLRKCPVSEAGIKALSRLPRLYTLDLSETPVTDAWLVHLHGCKQLYMLTLEESQVSWEGIRELHLKLPNCRVKWTPRRRRAGL